MSDQREIKDYLNVPLGRHHTDEQGDEAVERVWREFWVPIVGGLNRAVSDGSGGQMRAEMDLDMEQLKKELFDAHQLMRNTSILMCDITGGQVSKPMTDPSVVRELAEEHYNQYRDHDWFEFLMNTREEFDKEDTPGKSIVLNTIDEIIKTAREEFNRPA